MTKATHTLPTPTDHAEILAAIADINAGRVACAIEGSWGYTGAPWFRAANGWRFQVFNDCDEFDYFEEIVAPDGRRWEFDDIDANMTWRTVYDSISNAIDNYYRERWGIE